MYLALKLLHVAAVVLFLGNITTGLFWKAHGDRTRNPVIIAHTLDGIIRSDRWFTIPGVVVIIAGGVAAALVGGLPLLRTGWIAVSIVLFAISGLAFVLRVAPLQQQLLGLAQATGEPGRFDWEAYRKLSRSWKRWGELALLTPVAAFVIMVLKPTL
ncbi:MAG TPA: DUF2269 family protein [Gemmatimonadales bacterium]|jgi:uncharacterized membrane protein